MDGFSFNTTPQPQPTQQNNNDMFGLLDINMGSTSQPSQSTGGFGGDLLGFGMDTPTQPVRPAQTFNNQPVQSFNTQPVNNNNLMMTDLMGFGTPSNPPQNTQNNQNNMFGMNLLSNNGGFNQNPPQNVQPVQMPQQQQQQQQQNNGGFGLNLLGTSTQQQQPQSQPAQFNNNNSTGFQPIINNNPNKILAYDNSHLQIWMDCTK